MTPKQEKLIRERLAMRNYAFHRAKQLADEGKHSSLEYRIASNSYDIGYTEADHTITLLLAEIDRLRKELKRG